MAKTRAPKYERAIQKLEKQLEGYPNPAFLISAGSILRALRRDRPKTSLVALQLVETASFLLWSNGEAARVLMLAALALSEPKFQSALLEWARKVMEPEAPPKTLPPLPPVAGVPTSVIAALNQALSTLDVNKLPMGESVIATPVGPMQVLKLKNLKVGDLKVMAAQLKRPDPSLN